MAQERWKEPMYEFHDTIIIFKSFCYKIINHLHSRRYKPILACPTLIHKEGNSLLGKKFVFILKCQHLLCNKKQQQTVMPAHPLSRNNLMHNLAGIIYCITLWYLFLEKASMWNKLLSAKFQNEYLNFIIIYKYSEIKAMWNMLRATNP